MSMVAAVTLVLAEKAAGYGIPGHIVDGNDIVADWYRKTLGTPYEGSEPPEEQATSSTRPMPATRERKARLLILTPRRLRISR